MTRREYGIDRGYLDCHELLEQDDIDIVDIDAIIIGISPNLRAEHTHA